MAKPALGRGLGELLNGNGAAGTRAAPEPRTAAAPPGLSAGMSTLVRNAGETAPPAGRPVSPTVLRASLLAADLVLVSGGVFLATSRSAGDWKAVALALLAVLLGAWLGWLAVTWGRETP